MASGIGVLGSMAVRTRAMALTAMLGLALALFSANAGAGFAPEIVLAFDGSHGYVEVEAPDDIAPGSSSFTIEFWANIANDGWDLAFEWPGGDRVYVGHSTGNGWNFVTTTGGERVDTHTDRHIGDILERWVFVQAVQDRGEDTITLRVYDSQNGAWETASADTPTGETNPTGPLHIPSHPGDYPLKGMLAEMRFWHTPRTQSDAEADMLAGLTGDEEGLAGYWPQNEGEGDVAHDLSANANHGTIHGAEWTPFQPFLSDLPNHKEFAANEAFTLGPVELRDPEGDVTHQWYFNREPIEGATGSSLTIDEMTEKHIGTYHVQVDDDRELTPFESSPLRLTKPDWPMWRYGAARSADTPHVLEEDLRLQWVRELPEPKRAWRHQWDDQGKLDFDISYAPVVKDGRIFMPSNVTDSVTAYNIQDGAEEWRFYTDGPVRVAPAAWEDKVYFVSDDGHLYCVDAENGEQVWKFQGGPSDHRLLGNERIINFWAARGGPVIKDGIVYFAAGIWPMHGVFIHALDAASGGVEWVNDTTGSDYVQLPHGGATAVGSIAPQGYIAASEDRLVVAGGRTPPAFLNRHTGEVEHVALRAKPDGGYAVHAEGQGYMKNEMLADRVEALKGEIHGEVFYKLAAHDRLFVTTTDGTLYCFGPDETDPVHYEYDPAPLRPKSADWASTAQRLLEKLGESEGYALMLGMGSGDLLRELLYRSDLHIVVVEDDADQARALRDELAETGMYGRRAAVIKAKPAAFTAQPYLFSMVLSEDVSAAGIDADAQVLARLLEGLRPYGGVAYLGIAPGGENDYPGAAYAVAVDQVSFDAPADFPRIASRFEQEMSLLEAAQAADVDQVSVETSGDFASVSLKDDKTAARSRMMLAANVEPVSLQTPGAALLDAALAAAVDGLSIQSPVDFPRLMSSTSGESLSQELSRAIQAMEVDRVSVETPRRFPSPATLAFRGGRPRQADSEPRKDFVLAVRGGPLSGAGQWTHQYSDSSNTNFSPDSRAKAPLGVLWFGGPCNNNILPRHGHGPVPHVVGGRIILPGPETISARCVYTGREIWEQEFPGIGHPFTDQDLEERYRSGESVFMHNADGVGANQIGSPYVSLPDGIYVRYKTRVYRLAPDSGEIEAEFQLPVDPEREGKPDWGHLSVWNDLLITTVDPQVFDDEDYVDAFQTMEDIKGRDWDATSSNRLVVMDRHSGEVLWEREARIGFRHNAIVTGSGRLYLIDGLSEEAVQHLQRRGETPEDAALMALNPHTGEEQWKKATSIFGTWLNYSEPHDILVQGGRPGGLRGLDDEPSDRVAAYEGATGSALWEQSPSEYFGPLSIRGEEIYLAPSARSGQGWALDLHTGEEKRREQPHTGESARWTYNRRYGCNTHNVSEHLITFRSGAAAYFDLEHDSGTGFFGGFRSGCTNNMVVADGVVNAPDYTRTCTCSYQHQTSLALVHMPDDSNIEAWTTYDGAPPDPKGYGLNFGAPGRRVDRATGVTWHDEAGAQRRHPSAITDNGGGIDWVAASGRELNGEITVYDLLETEYTVRLHFAELTSGVETDERVFDVLIDGEEVLSGYDIVAEAGGCFRGVVEEFTVNANMTMNIELRKAEGSALDPFINGVEVVANEAELAATK